MSQECFGCEGIAERPVTLRDGRIVCTECEAYRCECESRHVLAMPFESRAEYLHGVEKKRGKEAADILKADIMEEFAMRKVA